MNPPLKWELGRCQVIYNTKILHTNEVLTQAALIEVLVRLNFILQSLADAGERVTFTDDVGKGEDITTLVNNIRNAACHSHGSLTKFAGATLIYNRIAGYVPNAIRINGTTIGCNYADDIAFNYGDRIIYLERHIARLLKELPPLVNLHFP